MAATWGSSLLGLVPSELKIGKAIRTLLEPANLWQSASSFVSELNWTRFFGCREASILLSSGLGRVRHALNLLQMEPVIKRLVISLILDKAFWSAIMNNRSVKKFLELLLDKAFWSAIMNIRSVKKFLELLLLDKTESPQICEEVHWGMNDLQWILDILKDKIVELIEKFKLLLIKILQLSQQPTPEATVDGSS